MYQKLCSHHKRKKAAKRSCCLLEPPNWWFEVVELYIRSTCNEHLLPPNHYPMSRFAQLREIAHFFSEEDQFMTICCLWKAHINFQDRADVEKEKNLLWPNGWSQPIVTFVLPHTFESATKSFSGLLVHEGLHFSPLTDMELMAFLLFVSALRNFSGHEIVINFTCALFVVDRTGRIASFIKISASAQSGRGSGVRWWFDGIVWQTSSNCLQLNSFWRRSRLK